MSTEGTKGGDVNRPGSAPEIQKLPRTVCRVCRLEAVSPIVVDGKCRNAKACELRQQRQKRLDRKERE